VTKVEAEEKARLLTAAGVKTRVRKDRSRLGGYSTAVQLRGDRRLRAVALGLEARDHRGHVFGERGRRMFDAGDSQRSSQASSRPPSDSKRHGGRIG
jgi:hypothetical protein